MYAEDENRKPGPDLLQLFQGVEAASFLQRGIEYCCVPILFPCQHEGANRGARFTKNATTKVTIDEVFTTLAGNFMGAKNEDSLHATCARYICECTRQGTAWTGATSSRAV